MKYIKLAKAQFKDKLFPEASKEQEIDIRTHMIWYDQVLKPSSTRYIRAKIHDAKQSLNGGPAIGFRSQGVDDLTKCQDELFEIVLYQLEK